MNTCDRCSAAALVRVVLLSGILEFCNHHFVAYKDHMDIIDTEAIMDEPVRV